MNNFNTHRKRCFQFVMASLAVVLLLVIFMCARYVSRLKQDIELENRQYLEEICAHVSALVSERVDGVLRVMVTTAEAWSSLDDDAVGMAYLKTVAVDNNFTRIGVIERNYHTQTSDGYETYLQNSEVDRVLGGEKIVVNLPVSPLDGNRVMLFLVPVWRGNEVIAAMFGTCNRDQMTALLQVESFSGQGRSCIIDGSGGTILVPPGGILSGSDNFFDSLETPNTRFQMGSPEEMRRNMENGLPGQLDFTLEGGAEQRLTYRSLEIEDWYLLSMVPAAVADAVANGYIDVSVGMNAVIVILFILLVILTIVHYRSSQKELEHLAFVDPVTGGINQSSFERRAERAIETAPAGTYDLVVMDIIRFKLINEAFGSSEGDRVLRHIHEVLLSRLEKDELVTRTAADKFNLLLRHRDAVETARRVEDWAQAINQFILSPERRYFFLVRAGAYTITDLDAGLIAMRDRANVARKSNRECRADHLMTLAFYTDVERERLMREKEIDDRKDSALENGEFVVYLQPKVELTHERVAGAEALIRWQDPEYGLVRPDEFIPAFERNGFITRIDLFVFEEVCKLLRRWIDEGIEPVPISVNLSRAHLTNPEFLAPYREVFSRYGVPPSLIEFEITETMANENLEQLVDAFKQLHGMGFGCALDDFGSGSSSLNTLKEVPADVLKLDRAFFMGDGDEAEERRGRHVVENVIELARKLNMQTVSEGVESMRQVEFLKEARCDLVQGFVYSQPLPIAEFERRLMGRDDKPTERGGAMV